MCGSSFDVCSVCLKEVRKSSVDLHLCVPLLLQFLHFTRAVKFSKAVEKRLFAKIVEKPNSNVIWPRIHLFIFILGNVS